VVGHVAHALEFRDALEQGALDAFLQGHDPCGSEPARESGGSAGNDVEYAAPLREQARSTLLAVPAGIVTLTRILWERACSR
jgi:hypothetical protein